jgi:methylated-DNA-[protein]-cysteine S-methyltransferase
LKLSHNATLYGSLFHIGGWELYLAVTDKGLCYVGAEPPDKTLNNPRIQEDQLFQPYVEQLHAYLQGKSTSFNITLDLEGTAFQKEVWAALGRIPFGETRSYTDIAAEIGRPASVRAVGAAIGANPVLIAVPCHRVLGKNGALTGYRGGLEMKKRLLELEQGHR